MTKFDGFENPDLAASYDKIAGRYVIPDMPIPKNMAVEHLANLEECNKNLLNEVKRLNSDLESERTARKKADKRALIISIVSIGVAIAAIVVSIFF